MPEVIDLKATDDPRDAVHQACQALAEGELVGLPSEADYVVVASTQSPLGLERLTALTGRGPCSLAVKSAEELNDYILAGNSVLTKLVRRGWPGPLAVQIQKLGLNGLFHLLPKSVHCLLLQDDYATFRSVAHPTVQHVQRLCPMPLMMVGDFGTRQIAQTARQLQELANNQLSLILDDGPCRFSEPPTTVRVHPDCWEICQPGIVSERVVGRLASDMILFVCTGNTCRSPMAEALFRRLLASRLNCTDDEVVDRGFVVMSAGISAALGAPASPEALKILAEEGIELQGHASQPLTQRLLTQADRIYTMTRGHQQAVLQSRPELQGRVHLLAPDGSDIVDPIGGSPADYLSCKVEIEHHLRGILTQVLPETPAS